MIGYVKFSRASLTIRKKLSIVLVDLDYQLTEMVDGLSAEFFIKIQILHVISMGEKL